ncbi:unnamed protein product [Caenorhabditis nigoni]
MVLRILLTLLILTYSPGSLSIQQCSKIGKDTVRCDSLKSFNGSSKTLIISTCEDLSRSDEIVEFGPWHTVTNVTFDCPIDNFPWEFADMFPNIRYIHFTRCNLTTLAWQSVYTETLKYVDLTHCPIECSCQNQWMRTEIFEKLKEPLSLRKCLPDCDTGRISINDSMIVGNGGENVTIRVDLKDQYINRTIEKPYFEWAYAKIRHNYEEVISESRAELVITNLTREDMGLIGVKCWHCVNFLTTKVELRVNLPIKVEFVEKTRGDTDFLVVQGYPIENITLAVTRVQSNYTEMNVMDNEQDEVFFSSMIVRPEKRSIFYQRTYRIFTKDIADGDHLSGDLRFEVCTTGNCDAVEKHVSHLGVINGTLDDYFTTASPYKRPIQILVTFIVIIALIITIILCTHYRMEVRTTIISLRKRMSLAHDLHSRRASHETEETLLRLEERSSLASDYCNMTLMFIDMGKIQIHELVGKGHFGEVYVGSWEQTGPRSVAVKSIRGIDMETEKEARVLQNLEHDNIVRLFGMTMDRGNLLLVFEHMNYGDLKTYLQARSPTASSYLQFPPPLVSDELKWIIREIAKGVCYLVSQSIVHRDLAARNCLVSGESDMKAPSHLQRPPFKIKISDFGMSRRLYDDSECYTMEHRGALPIRWLPPEAISSHKFTYASDIWALGVTMWEVMSYGKQPFDGLSNLEVSSFTMAGLLDSGMKPVRPEKCSSEMYRLMTRCWKYDPNERITAEELFLDEIFDKVKNGLPYVPSAENGSMVASYNENVNRYEDESTSRDADTESEEDLGRFNVAFPGDPLQSDVDTHLSVFA